MGFESRASPNSISYDRRTVLARIMLDSYAGQFSAVPLDVGPLEGSAIDEIVSRGVEQRLGDYSSSRRVVGRLHVAHLNFAISTCSSRSVGCCALAHSRHPLQKLQQIP
jgi:hypothetical protein